MSKEAKKSPHWLYRLLTGTYGYNGVNFFEIISLAHENDKIFKELMVYYKKHNLL